MPIRLIMKIVFSVMLIFFVLPLSDMLYATPLESGYALAPSASASPDEKARAYINARIRVVEAAQKYLGVPYRYGGMTTAGLDCSGFLGLSFKDALGVSLPRSASGLYTWTVRIPVERAQPGDFVFFKTDGTNNITHVGLYLGNRRFIHAASAGSQTGVIYSNLDERYYVNTYAGAGRAFPEAAPFNIDNTSVSGSASSGRQGSANNQPGTARNNASSGGSGKKGRVKAGVAAAPVWSNNVSSGIKVRGFTSQICIEAETYPFGARNIFGLELRPEYDGLHEIFRLPVTLSWGFNENIKLFAGPVFTFSETWGTTWRAVIGVTAYPFIIRTAGGNFAPYIEAAWQSNFSNGSGFSFNSDFSSNFRLSTGIKWLIPII